MQPLDNIVGAILADINPSNALRRTLQAMLIDTDGKNEHRIKDAHMQTLAKSGVENSPHYAVTGADPLQNVSPTQVGNTPDSPDKSR
jgi:hypothetical protein